MDITELNRISKKFGNFSFANFYPSDDRDYSLIAYDCCSGTFNHLDGFYNNALKENHINRFTINPNVFAAYAPIKDQTVHSKIIDLYFFNTKLLDKTFESELYELLVFHEIVHWIEKNKLDSELHIYLSEDDKRVGKKLEEIAQDIADRTGSFNDFNHNEAFGSIFNYFLRLTHNSRRSELLGKAMIMNFLEDRSNEFQ